MNDTSKITNFENYLLEHNKKDLITINTEQNNKKETPIEIDLQEMILTLPFETTECLMENPTLITGELQVATKNAARIDNNNNKNIRIIYKNLPYPRVNIWQLREEHISKLIHFEAFIRGITAVHMILNKAIFECPKCGNVMKLIRTEVHPTINMPSRCGCGYKGDFKITDREYANRQRILFEEQETEDCEKSGNIIVILEGCLTDLAIDKNLREGKKCWICGTVEVEEIINKNRTKEYKIYILANNIKVIDEGFDKIKLTKEKEAQITLEIENESLINNLKASVLPNHKFDEEIKEGIVLSLAGSRKVIINNIIKSTGNLNILMVGSPGTGKSQLIKQAINISPVHKFATGSSASSIGLTAAVTKKDEMLGEPVIKAGVIPLADKGFAGIDELDKIDKDELGKLNNAMTDNKIIVDKAGLHREFPTDTTIIAAMNPIYKVFLNSEKREEQIPLNDDFKDRFALIYCIEPRRNPKEREEIAKAMISTYNKSNTPPYSLQFLREYYAYIRRFNPEISDEIQDYIISRENSIIEKATEEISYRLIDKITQISVAYARLKYRNVTKADVDSAVKILMVSYKQRDLLNEVGLVTFEAIENVDDKQTLEKKKDIREMIIESCRDKLRSINDIQQECIQSYGISETAFDDMIEKMRIKGDIMEQKPGWIKSL